MCISESAPLRISRRAHRPSRCGVLGCPRRLHAYLISALLPPSFFQAAVNTTKLVVGVGSFSLPAAFRMSGMVGGVIGIPLLAVWAAFAMKLMVDVREDLGPRASYFDCGR